MVRLLKIKNPYWMDEKSLLVFAKGTRAKEKNIVGVPFHSYLAGMILFDFRPYGFYITGLKLLVENYLHLATIIFKLVNSYANLSFLWKSINSDNFKYVIYYSTR